MKSSVADEFIKYAKEQFGCDIYLQHSAESDSFASIFGASFLNQNGPMESNMARSSAIIYGTEHQKEMIRNGRTVNISTT